MSETKLSPKKQLHSMLYEAGIFQAFPCSSEENEQYAKMLANNEPLPAGVYRYRNQNGDDTDQFYTSNKDELTDAERLQMIELQKRRSRRNSLRR